jgi:hypothetical protein
MKTIICAVQLVVFCAASAIVNAQPIGSLSTGNNSPSISQTGANSTSVVNYGPRERIGKKIAIRKAYLRAYPNFDLDTSKKELKSGALFEKVELVVVVQSIWPEPILLTAGRIKTSNLHTDRGLPGGLSDCHLAERITDNPEPASFLILPGEKKEFALRSGFNLDGVMGFFTERVIDSPLTPYGEEVSLYGDKLMFVGSSIVKELNQFFTKKFGGKASIRLTLFEKDYQPLLVTTFLLNGGEDIFSRGDVGTSKYALSHDLFIGTVIGRIRDRKSGAGLVREKKSCLGKTL